MSQMQVPLYDGKIPGARANALEEEYLESPEGLPLVKGIAIPKLYLYLASENGQPTPCVIIFPGGGYVVEAYAHEGEAVARALNAAGISAVVVRYRLPLDEIMHDKSIGPLQDAQQAILKVRQHATEWNLLPDKIGIMGFSAGGHLAATAGTHFNDPRIKLRRRLRKNANSLRPDFMMLVYPVISMQDSMTHGGSRQNLLGAHPSLQKINYFSNELHVQPHTPPTFLVHAEDDGAVPIANSLEFAKRLAAAGVPHELFRYPSGGHGFGLVNPKDSRQWLEAAIAWLNNL